MTTQTNLWNHRHPGAELLVDPLAEGIDAETGTETGGDIMYASVLAIIVPGA